MMPGISLNCRRTSTTTDPAARPTAVIAMPREQIGDEAAEDEAGDDVGIGEVEIDDADILEIGRADLGEVPDVVGVGREQNERAEARRSDRVAFGDRLGRIADRVERVGRLTHFLRQPGHFGDAAGVVGDRSEGVERDNHAGEAKHGRDRDRGAEESRELVGRDDAGDDDERGKGRRFERDCEALDHVGAVAGYGGLRDGDHGTLAGAGVIFGDDDDQAGDGEADEAADEEVLAGDRRHRRLFRHRPSR